MTIASKTIIYLLVVIFLLALHTYGQPNCKVQYYSTEQGLSHQSVSCILKDHEGFMWFGSWNGINRFDGRGFTSYRSLPGDGSQLASDRIDQIVEDQSDHLWVRGYDKQIYRFDKKKEKFLPLSDIIKLNNTSKIRFKKTLAARHGVVWLESFNEGVFCVPQNDLTPGNYIRYKTGLSADYELPANTINFFHEDSEHRIWMGTPGGLCCLTRSENGIYKNTKIIPDNARNENFVAFCQDALRLYFGTASGILFIYNKKTKNFIHLRIGQSITALKRSGKKDCLYATTSNGKLVTVDLRDPKFSVFSYSFENGLYSLYEDHFGNLWMSSEKNGVVRFDVSKNAFKYFAPRNNHYHGYGISRFWIFEDNSGTIWVKMKGGGLCYYNEGKGMIHYSFNIRNSEQSELADIIQTLYYDPAGVLWLTTDERGIFKIIFQENDFKLHPLVHPAITRSDNDVRGIFYDNKERLWLGAKSGKLYVYQNGRQLSNLFINEPPEGFGDVYSILQDSRGNIWMGTKANGLFKASPVNKEATRYRVTHFLADKNNINGLSSNEIYALLEDRQGRIWVGSFDEGLNLATGYGDSVKFVHSGDAFRNYPKGSFHKIRHMTSDSAGLIWIGTTDGLLLLDANDRHSPVYSYVEYRKKQGDIKSLGNNDVQFIYQDSKQRMWLATSGGGFCLAIGDHPLESLTFRNYTTRDGMPNDYVLSCVEDRKGGLWIATENGLTKFNPQSGLFRNYDTYDGVPKVSFSEASACRRLPDGQLIFGTNKGYLGFNPDSIDYKSTSANIAFTHLQVNNADASPAANNPALKININYVPDLTLKYNQNIISIDYAILDYRASDKQAFAYRLIGFDSTWHNDRRFRRATYTNLPPGHYVFEVKNINTDLYSTTPYKQLSITILPPLWKTWWAYSSYAIIAMLILAVIRRNAVAMIRLRNKIALEQKLAALKLQFFTNISHELRTPLTLIVNPLEQLAQQEKLSQRGTAYVEVARKNANRMVRFINELLDLRKVQSDKAALRISRVEIVSFVKKIIEHFREAARSKHIMMEIVAEQKELTAWIDAEKMDVVIYNLVGNALKFTPAGKKINVFINPIPHEKSFSIAVQDEGPGVEKDKLEKIFELFQEGEHRTDGVLKGSGIGLALSKEFINLHGGTIRAENNQGGGLTVTIKMSLQPDYKNVSEVSYIETPATDFTLRETPIGQQILPVSNNGNLPKDMESPLVLLVEDNTDLGQFLKYQLSEFYRVETARNGQEGWQMAVELVPDLIISDIMMPVMDGIQMLDKIKNDINTSHIPVVLLSAKYSIESQIEGLQYGADYYITKPFNNQFLIASINNLLRQRKRLFESLVQKKKTPVSTSEPIVVTGTDEIFLKEVIRTVEEKMDEPDFNIDIVAERMAMGRTTFFKKFKSLTGMAPVEFVRDMRLQRAKQYLDAGNNKIAEVAYMVGFASPKYFSTCFKEKYHISPSDFIKGNKKAAKQNLP